jgi:hypothetical protein
MKTSLDLSAMVEVNIKIHQFKQYSSAQGLSILGLPNGRV